MGISIEKKKLSEKKKKKKLIFSIFFAIPLFFNLQKNKPRKKIIKFAFIPSHMLNENFLLSSELSFTVEQTDHENIINNVTFFHFSVMPFLIFKKV